MISLQRLFQTPTKCWMNRDLFTSQLSPETTLWAGVYWWSYILKLSWAILDKPLTLKLHHRAPFWLGLFVLGFFISNITYFAKGKVNMVINQYYYGLPNIFWKCLTFFIYPISSRQTVCTQIYAIPKSLHKVWNLLIFPNLQWVILFKAGDKITPLCEIYLQVSKHPNTNCHKTVIPEYFAWFGLGCYLHWFSIDT